MSQIEKEEITQAIVIADNFNEKFRPMTDNVPLALLPLVNVPLIDYSLETLNLSGILEVFVFCCSHIDQIKNHLSTRKAEKCSWSIGMTIHVVSSEGCGSLGDALRDLDAKGLIRGNFILMGVDTITTAKLQPLLKAHKQQLKFDKGTAMTVVYKHVDSRQRTGEEVVLGIEKQTRRLLFHQRLKSQSGHKEAIFRFPLEIFTMNPQVMLHHNIADPQLAVCSAAVLPLFADNFDFASRDDFVKGLLINEEILDSRIYVSLLGEGEYAARVSNWQTYQMVSADIVNRWAYPLTPDMGICDLKQNYVFLRNNIYKSKNVHLARGGILKNDCVVNENCTVDEQAELANVIMGRNCKIGKSCQLLNCFLFDNVTVEDNCKLINCVVGHNVIVGTGSRVTGGAVLGDDVVLPPKTEVSRELVKSKESEDGAERLGPHAFTIPDENGDADSDLDSDSEVGDEPEKIVRLGPLEDVRNYASSVYSSSSDDDDDDSVLDPVLDDSSIFFNEVMESLKRGYEEKSNPEFLILEINSSRYAYNIGLSEVNFLVMKAIFSFPALQSNVVNVVNTLAALLKYFGTVITNYIRGKSAMHNCLKAFEECCDENLELLDKAAKLVHYLYDKEIVDEEAILEWHEQLENEDLRRNMAKLVEWLEQSSGSSEEEDD